MSDPRFRPAAAHTPEEFGDVLHNIRRLIAEDEALSAARDRLEQARSQVRHEDPADFLARRYGGNAALARQLATAEAPARDLGAGSAQSPHPMQPSPATAAPTVTPLPVPAPAQVGSDPDTWPLGAMANAPEAPRPRNDLAMRLGSLFQEMEDEPTPEDSTHDPAELFERLVEDAADKPLQLTQPETPSAQAQPAGEDDEEEAIRDLLREIVQEQIALGLDARLAAQLDARIRTQVLPEVADSIGPRLDAHSATLIAQVVPQEVASAMARVGGAMRAEIEAGLSDSLRASCGTDLRESETRLREELNDHLDAQIGTLTRQLPEQVARTMDQVAETLPAMIRDRIGDTLPSALEHRLPGISAGLREDLHKELPPVLLSELLPVVDARLTETVETLRPELLSSVQAAVQFELDTSLEGRLRSGLRDAAMGELRETVQTEIESDLPARIRQETRHILPEILPGILATDLPDQLHEIVRDQIQAEIRPTVDASLRGQLQDWIRAELPEGLTMLVRDQMQDALRSAVNDGIRAELQAMIQAELLGELGERFSRNLRIVIRREVAAAVDAQVERL